MKNNLTGLQCVSCNAPLSAKTQYGTIITCDYCRTENVLSKEIRQITANDTHRFIVVLVRAITDSFDSLDEIKNLVLITSGEVPDYRLSYDDLAGSTVSAKSRELVQWCRRRGLLQPLVDVCLSLRPHMDLT